MNSLLDDTSSALLNIVGTEFLHQPVASLPLWMIRPRKLRDVFRTRHFDTKQQALLLTALREMPHGRIQGDLLASEELPRGLRTVSEDTCCIESVKEICVERLYSFLASGAWVFYVAADDVPRHMSALELEEASPLEVWSRLRQMGVCFAISSSSLNAAWRVVTTGAYGTPPLTTYDVFSRLREDR